MQACLPSIYHPIPYPLHLQEGAQKRKRVSQALGAEQRGASSAWVGETITGDVSEGCAYIYLHASSSYLVHFFYITKVCLAASCIWSLWEVWMFGIRYTLDIPSWLLKRVSSYDSNTLYIPKNLESVDSMLVLKSSREFSDYVLVFSVHPAFRPL